MSSACFSSSPSPTPLSLSSICWALTLGMSGVVTWTVVRENQGPSYSSKSIGATRTQGSLRNPARQRLLDRHHMCADSAHPSPAWALLGGPGSGKVPYKKWEERSSKSMESQPVHLLISCVTLGESPKLSGFRFCIHKPRLPDVRGF